MIISHFSKIEEAISFHWWDIWKTNKSKASDVESRLEERESSLKEISQKGSSQSSNINEERKIYEDEKVYEEEKVYEDEKHVESENNPNSISINENSVDLINPLETSSKLNEGINRLEI